MWWQFAEDCGHRPTGEAGRELSDEELVSSWEPNYPRVPLEYLVCTFGRNQYTHVDLNGIGHHPMKFTMFYYAAFSQSPTDANCADAKGEIEGIAMLAGKNFQKGLRPFEFYGMPDTKPGGRIRLVDY